MTNIKIHESWKNELLNQFNSQYMSELRVFLKEQLSSGKEIFPPIDLIFNAINLTLLTNVKVVMVGQDTYKWK